MSELKEGSPRLTGSGPLLIEELRRLDPRSKTFSGLVELLIAVVDAGGSLGFVAPLSAPSAVAYWTGVGKSIADREMLLLVARKDDALVGTVQLHPSVWPDGRHRAELAKLMVAPGQRRLGVGNGLTEAAEHLAIANGRTLLVLNTREGDPSETLYSGRGYRHFGSVPGYLTDGARMYAKSYWYKHLTDGIDQPTTPLGDEVCKT